ncbi:hypothetical protein BN927_02177 [Lactococcus lactis subsp. lactis Dephy 1]|uniref:hypothetical protein n=1 Tax=Lactococcus lactis TaxID=1358 RepID=UPI0003B82A3F|nr:hypothetical protein [Lactococcus lactis]CDI47110.1 hypothetical protein BN927_02177 [Lactococcus lactis subsp. lactis Dephy 1]
MEFEDFKKYVEENCRAKSIFLPKVTTYITDQINSDENKVYLSPSQIQYEVKKAWNDALRNLYAKLNSKVKTKKTDSYPIKVEKWLADMNELEILDEFTDSIDDMEFE